MPQVRLSSTPAGSSQPKQTSLPRTTKRGLEFQARSSSQAISARKSDTAIQSRSANGAKPGNTSGGVSQLRTDDQGTYGGTPERAFQIRMIGGERFPSPPRPTSQGSFRSTVEQRLPSMPELVFQSRLIGGDRFGDAPGQISHQSRPSSAPAPITIDTPAAPRVGPPSAPASMSVNLAPDDRRQMVASSLRDAAIIESDAFPDHPVERINLTPVVIKPNARGFGAQEEAKNGFKRLTLIRREEEHPHSTINPEHHLLDQEKRVRSHKKRKIVPSDLPAKPPISPAEVSLAAPRAVARTRAAATRSLPSSPRKVGAYVEPMPIQIDEPDTPLSKKERKIREVMDRLNRLDKDFSSNKERVFRYRLDEFQKGSRQALAGTCPELQDAVEELERERLKEVEDAEIFRD
ncbi:hypothetical protein HKX48_001707, partial [Thoreauomyces humboldtii]